MKTYTITQELVDAIQKTLFELNLPVQSYSGILQSLIKTPVVEKVEEVKEK